MDCSTVNRQHGGDQLGQAKRGEFKENKRGLPIADQTVEQDNRPVDPEQCDQNERKEAEQQ